MTKTVEENARSEKGKSLLEFPDSYTVVDIETTGFSPKNDSIIEIGALRIRKHEAVASYKSLCYPGKEIGSHIVSLTGITNKDVANAPHISTVLKEFLEFLGDDIIVGHNINFDINFLYEKSVEFLERPLKNDYVDTLRLSRILLPNLEHHSLEDVVEYFDIHCEYAHRASYDCSMAYQCFENLRTFCDPEELKRHTQKIKDKKKSRYINLNEYLKSITIDMEKIDPCNPFCGKNCVFTGKLETLTRQEAAEILTRAGGHFQGSVTKKTDYLILGFYDYISSIKGDKSLKHKRAEELISIGYDIKIISEKEYIELLKSNNV